jgi:hypothetical protein
VKRVRVLLVLFIIIIVSGGVSRSAPAGEETDNPQKEKGAATPESPSGKKGTVTIKTGPGVSVSAPKGEKPAQPRKEKATPPEAQAEKKATLKVKNGSGNTIGIDLINSVPIRGVQFTISGVTMTEVRTTSRTEGFLAKFNEETGIVILVSTAADEIPPGKGSVLDVIGEKVPGSTVSLTRIMIVDKDRKQIE